MVCITVYSEPYDQLMRTLNAVFDNLEEFKRAGICNEDIACIVYFFKKNQLFKLLNYHWKKKNKYK